MSVRRQALAPVALNPADVSRLDGLSGAVKVGFMDRSLPTC
jgi:hypothetical protein